MKRLENICKYIIISIWGVIIFYLALLSMQGTSYDEILENSATGWHVYYLKDNVWKHIILLTIFILICVLLKEAIIRLKWSNKIRFLSNSYVALGVFLILAIVGAFFIICTQLKPRADARVLQDIAQEMLEGDFSSFLQGEYMDCYPHQSGFLLLIYYMMQLFGKKEFLVMQFLNLFAVIILFYFSYKIVALIWSKKSNLFLALEMAFIPILLYTSFIYGNILSYAVAMCAIYLEYQFFLNQKMRYAISSAILISLSIIWKSNSLIILCAMILFAIYIIYKAQKRHKLKAIIYTICLVFFCTAGSKLVEVHMESIIGMELPNGIPKIAWVAMGLCYESSEGPGYYNDVTKSIYKSSDYNNEKATQEALQWIKVKMKRYVNDYRLGFDFFGRKIAAQWNDPTFECLKINRGRESEVGLPKWIKSILEGKGSIYLKEFLNLYQTWIYFGVCLFVVIRFRKIRIDELLFAIIMIGGFLFHLFWEAKSQYTLFYFFLMMPYSFMGYQMMIDKVGNLFQKIRSSALTFNKKRIALGCIVITLGVGLLIPLSRRIASMKTYQYTLGVRSSDELLEEYNAMIDCKKME